MDKVLIFILAHVAFSAAVDDAKGIISTPKFGTVQAGQTLNLKYKAATKWINCFWYRYDTPNAYEYCMYTRAGENLVTTCQPEEFKNHLKFKSEDDLTCGITIEKVSEADNSTWSVRVDAELENTDIEITVAIQAANINIKADPIPAGEYGEISCQVGGARPAPMVSYKFEDSPGNPSPEVNSTMSQVSDDKGIFTTNNVVLIKPTIKDYNRTFYCGATQKVGDQPLFEPLKAETKLNVIFPPLPRDDGQGTEDNPMMFGAEVGEDLLIEVKFLANPKPTSVEWQINSNKTDGDNSDVTIPAGKSDDHYKASDLMRDYNEISHKAQLTIKKLQKSDHSLKHKLVVKNSQGTTMYHFNVELHKVSTTTTTTTTTTAPTTTTTGGSTGTTTPSPPPKGGDVVVYVVVVICIVLVLVALGFFIFRRWNKNRTETAPLR